MRGDIVTSEDKTPPSEGTVVYALLCPRHRRVGLYTGGRTPSYSTENGLLPNEPTAGGQ